MPRLAVTHEIRDRAAIYDLLMRYAQGLDRRDFSMVAGCFSPDVQAEYDGAVLPTGVANVIDYLQRRPPSPVSMHFTGTHYVRIKGAVADVETYCIAHLAEVRDGRTYLIVLGLRFLDRMVRRRRQWLIAPRVQTCDWVREEPLGFPKG